MRVNEDDVFPATWTEATALAERWVTVAAIAPVSLQDGALRAFSSFDPKRKHWRPEHLGEGITLLTPSLAKGLEFDAVVLIEPARIIGEELHGYRMLYIALTRAVQELVVVHARDLPQEISWELA